MKQKRYPRYLASAILILIAWGCVETTDPDTTQVVGYIPVYAAIEQKEIKLGAPTTIKNPGKIYNYGSFLLVNERGRGIHVFNNADPLSPQPVGFISILGNHDMAVKNDVLYADHMGNIVSVEIDDFQTLTQTGTLPIQNWNLGAPPPSQSYFVCPDPSKGVVVEWKSETMLKPGCYATY